MYASLACDASHAVVLKDAIGDVPLDKHIKVTMHGLQAKRIVVEWGQRIEVCLRLGLHFQPFPKTIIYDVNISVLQLRSEGLGILSSVILSSLEVIF